MEPPATGPPAGPLSYPDTKILTANGASRPSAPAINPDERSGLRLRPRNVPAHWPRIPKRRWPGHSDIDATVTTARSPVPQSGTTPSGSTCLRLPRPWSQRGRRAAGDHAACWQRRIEHRCRPQRDNAASAGTASRSPAAKVADPRRFGGYTDEFLAWLAKPERRLAYSSVHHHRRCDMRSAKSRPSLDADYDFERIGPAQRMGRRDHRHTGPVVPGPRGCG